MHTKPEAKLLRSGESFGSDRIFSPGRPQKKPETRFPCHQTSSRAVHGHKPTHAAAANSRGSEQENLHPDCSNLDASLTKIDLQLLAGSGLKPNRRSRFGHELVP